MNRLFLLSRIVLSYNGEDESTAKSIRNLSAVAFTPDGTLWLGSDEFTSIDRLTAEKPHHYSGRVGFDLANILDLPSGSTQEIDIEGLSYSAPYLWVVGSHSTKRKKPKQKDTSPKRLKQVVSEENRYLLARIPIDFSDPANPVPVARLGSLMAAALPMAKEGGNPLTQEFERDEYLKHFAISNLPSKENGIDIEGLAVKDNRVFIGFRGPVLRGWAILLELDIETSATDKLTLTPIGSGNSAYKKHFLDLNGLGIRELCLHGDDLLILAGPTMTAFGGMQVFRLKNAFDLEGDGLLRQSERLELLFNLPFNPSADNAEGVAVFSWDEEDDSICVVFDSPSQERIISNSRVYADIFSLKNHQ